MGTCFIIQPFDRDIYDKRCEEIFKPAIKAANLEPYRVDEDPAASIPIESIEKGIRESQVCLAEITLDNPNVWFELGYAIAAQKEVVLICSNERKLHFPFDIQHRSIIKYSTGIPSDFDTLKSKITERLTAYANKPAVIATIKEISKTALIDGLESHEIATLATLAENIQHIDDSASVRVIQSDMEKAGYTKFASILSLKSLSDKGFVERGEFADYDSTYYGYTLTGKGWEWMLQNKHHFAIKKPMKPEDWF